MQWIIISHVSQRHSTTCSELGQINALGELQIGQNKTLGEFLRGQNLSLVTIKRILLLLRVLFSVRKVQFTVDKYSKNILRKCLTDYEESMLIRSLLRMGTKVYFIRNDMGCTCVWLNHAKFVIVFLNFDMCKKHVESVHEKRKPFKCLTCNAEVILWTKKKVFMKRKNNKNVLFVNKWAHRRDFLFEYFCLDNAWIWYKFGISHLSK